MQLHTFQARSLAEALRLVRAELGSEASVLQTREVGSPLSRWLGGRTIEVTATTEIAAPRRLAEPMPTTRMPAAELQDFRQAILHSLFTDERVEPSIVEQLAATSQPLEPRRPALSTLQSILARAGVSKSTSQRWLQQLRAELACDPECHADAIRERLRHIVAADLPVCGPIRLQASGLTIVALLGPTGVGKTTTLAKLAMQFQWHEHCRVAVITTDTCRIAATGQFQAYARLLDLPMEVVSTPQEMAVAIQRFQRHDLVLIDTAGCGPRDQQRLQDLQALLTAAEPHVTMLVQSATADGRSQQLTTRTFAQTGVTSLILTRLDEAAHLGSLPDLLRTCHLPLAYTTHGQNVRGGISPAHSLHLADLLLNPEP